MLQKLKRLGSYLIIIVLLPYVITVFMNGQAVPVSNTVDTMQVRVNLNGKEGNVPLTDYCIGRMAKEIPVSYNEEALKAQAVLVRTTVYTQIRDNGSQAVFTDGYWTTDDMREQWGSGSYRKNYNRLKNAWDDTEGQVLMYGEQLAYVPYCRLTNGNTRDGKEVLGSDDYPYLKIKECPYDIEAKEQIQTKVLDDMEASITGTDTAGYVTSVQVGNETMSGEEFREKYELASGSFVLQKYDGKLRVTSRGVGHGLGLSQYSADKMAKDGKTYDEILAYFFEGTELKEVADIVSSPE